MQEETFSKRSNVTSFVRQRYGGSIIHLIAQLSNLTDDVVRAGPFHVSSMNAPQKSNGCVNQSMQTAELTHTHARVSVCLRIMTNTQVEEGTQKNPEAAINIPPFPPNLLPTLSSSMFHFSLYSILPSLSRKYRQSYR